MNIRLRTDDVGADRAPFEQLIIRASASDKPFLFFGIRSWRESDLIEPLRDYGVELRREDEEIRTWNAAAPHVVATLPPTSRAPLAHHPCATGG